VPTACRYAVVREASLKLCARYLAIIVKADPASHNAMGPYVHFYPGCELWRRQYPASVYGRAGQILATRAACAAVLPYNYRP